MSSCLLQPSEELLVKFKSSFLFKLWEGEKQRPGNVLRYPISLMKEEVAYEKRTRWRGRLLFPQTLIMTHFSHHR